MAGFEDIKVTVPDELRGQRLDSALASITPFSRRRLQKAIDEGGVYLNRKRCRKAGKLVHGGEKVRVVVLENEVLTPFAEEQIIWRQDAWVLVHKRTEQYSQEALHRTKGTLVYELGRSLNLSPADSKRLRPVHRLDRGTSGLNLFSYEPKALQLLQNQWHSSVQKTYLAVVSPVPDWKQKVIEEPLSARPDRQGRYTVVPDGKASKTEALVLEVSDNRALIRLTPYTGRTHQLRVHMAFSGCPMVGDNRYGGQKHHRLMLHAQSLTIKGEAMGIKTPELNWSVEPEGDWTW